MLKELMGLFVDDLFLAVGLLVWVAIAGYLLPTLSIGVWGGPMLFLGVAFVLVASLRKAIR
ncbi:hypothetical protein GCM10011611_30370 [Aliidongia dinghuensis]|uniref:Uncharacterized protein n=1 Tax=Aliidongia dinghuensis TaxID=1867774 RepID=A0A8J2YVU5_9PROT|nr:hypothetical protein GCM10011611_30370 [Aliidongia dinghuensis]